MVKEAFHIARCKLELNFEEPKYGPGSLSYPIELWPASQEFKQELPAEEVRVKPSILVNIVATGRNKSDVPRFVKLVNECLAISNDLQKCVNILARILQAQISKKSTNVCLDLLGPTLVKGIVNKRSTMKVWPLIFVYQATGAIHLSVMHDYGTQAFLLQYTGYINLRGKPTKIVSDKGSQLTSSHNVVAFADHEAPENWGWSEVEQKTAQDGTSWEFVPAGCQYRNGLAERRVAVVKQTLKHVLGSTIIANKHSFGLR